MLVHGTPVLAHDDDHQATPQRHPIFASAPTKSTYAATAKCSYMGSARKRLQKPATSPDKMSVAEYTNKCDACAQNVYGLHRGAQNVYAGHDFLRLYLKGCCNVAVDVILTTLKCNLGSKEKVEAICEDQAIPAGHRLKQGAEKEDCLTWKGRTRTCNPTTCFERM